VDEVYELRKLLWLNHGHNTSAMLRDGEEMPCFICGLNFKRDSTEHIADRLDMMNYLRWRAPVDIVE